MGGFTLASPSSWQASPSTDGAEPFVEATDGLLALVEACEKLCDRRLAQTDLAGASGAWESALSGEASRTIGSPIVHP